ncbi:putative oxidoreductase YdhV [Maioricimonas rarisocia]|uniref:Putative oxidoreductase YdhV n=1 Tax=Maioricimonas rarisocia TaxID=2528026 RepID=A0A517Z1Z7_9PLAN|nr:aldehyde ferredoxin oxidoreductase family protein [Maioricimonas rarisocia]QDU36502.1 putative oxidoreductase YdhV [Maioricimonas rarisocia]
MTAPADSRAPGYHGRYLRVDLTQQSSEPREIPLDVLRQFIGGSGLGTWMLLQECPDGIDPLAPQAPLLFVFSPLVGSPLTTSAKFAVMAKSPLTGRINDSLSSSHFAIAGKKTGYDAIVIVGKAASPCCLLVTPDGVSFEDAGDLWGQPGPATEEQLRQRFARGYRFTTIGPAGENLVRYATASHAGRHAGRGGLGAVMGSKHLKALGVAGDRLTTPAHSDDLIRYARDLSRRSFGPATAKYRELGTISNLLTFNRLGSLPTRNFQQSSFEGTEQLAPETAAAAPVRTRSSCAACTIGCEHIFHRPGKTGVRMEYENLFALGPLCGISDSDVVLEASSLCDELGMDTISAGATIAFAMECAERGMIDAPDLRFGNGEALHSTLRKIARRDGLGDLLAEGSRLAAAQIGQGAPDIAPHVKGLELPGYEPRALQTMALGFAVGTRGADHNRSGAYQVDFSEEVNRFDPGSDAIPRAIETENEAALMDSLILCKFLRGVFDDRLASMAEMLHLVTGWDVDADELTRTSERIVTAKKWFNIRQGWTPAEDTLPRRFLTQPLADGPGIGVTLSEETLRQQIRAYNLARGWTPDGWVPEQLLVDCGLSSQPEGSSC